MSRLDGHASVQGQASTSTSNMLRLGPDSSLICGGKGISHTLTLCCTQGYHLGRQSR